METAIVLAIYIVGVYVAYFQLKRWNTDNLRDDDEYLTLFVVSTLSWFIYPIWLIAWLFDKVEERQL